MAWDSRRSRRAPAAGSSPDPFESTIQFSSVLPEPSINDVQSPTWQDNTIQVSNVLPEPSNNGVQSPTRQDSAESHGSSLDPVLTGTTRRADSNKVPYVDYSETLVFPRKPTRQITGSSFRSTASSIWSATKDYGVSHFNVPRLAAPWEHEIAEKVIDPPVSHTVREFEPHRQRRRLWTNSIFQFSLTLILSGGLAACLAGFQSIPALLLSQKHAFNAIMTALSIALGLNLASSFKSYAQMMRWRFLASSYRTLQEFELVLQCESQSKVFRLLWTARTKGKLWINKTQLLCLSWITVNVLLQVLVALLGLTYNLDTSSWLNTSLGQLSICQLHTIQGLDNTYGDVNNLLQLGAANTYGVESASYGIESADGYSSELNDRTLYTDGNTDGYPSVNWTYFMYRFEDQNPNDNSITIVSDRTIQTTASCTQYEVISGGYGIYNATSEINYMDENGKNRSVWFDTTVSGAISWMSNTNSSCGPRCTEVWALQCADLYTIMKPAFFKCVSEVSHVSNTQEYVEPGQTASLYDMPDLQARIMAGAIGWSGYFFVNNTWEYQVYSLVTQWSPYYEVNTTEVAWLISLFSAGGIAAMDYQGPRINITGWYPVQSQLVTVQWNYAGAILGAVPFIQFLALLCIIRWANRVIIKDTGSLSNARLLRPIVDRLGPTGCLLTTDEICEEMRNIRVTYGYRQPGDFVEGTSMVRHVDILEEMEGLGRKDKMPPGRYDGISHGRQSTREGLVLRE